ncbi:MAG: hypothetical protein WC840_05665 [Candidatus Peribacteraceae bacterium]
MPPKNPVTATTVEAKLDEIVLHLRRLDRRDRMRTIGGFIRGFLALIPLLLLLWSVWYFIQHGDEIMKKIADQAASSAAEFTQQKGQGLLDQLKKEYSYPNK